MVGRIPWGVFLFRGVARHAELFEAIADDGPVADHNAERIGVIMHH